MDTSRLAKKPLAAALAAAALLGSLAPAATAQIARSAAYVPPASSRSTVVTGTFVFTGPVTRASSGSITVNHNGILRPAAVFEDTRVTRNGRGISARNLRRGEWVRVTAVQVGPNQWESTRIEVVRPSVARARVGAADRVATYREERIIRDRWGAADPVPVTPPLIPEFSGVGEVVSVNGGEDSFKVRIGENTRRVYAEYAQISGVMRVRDLKKGDRVRIVGGLHGRDVLADRVDMLD